MAPRCCRHSLKVAARHHKGGKPPFMFDGPGCLVHGFATANRGVGHFCWDVNAIQTEQYCLPLMANTRIHSELIRSGPRRYPRQSSGRPFGSPPSTCDLRSPELLHNRIFDERRDRPYQTLTLHPRSLEAKTISRWKHSIVSAGSAPATSSSVRTVNSRVESRSNGAIRLA